MRRVGRGGRLCRALAVLLIAGAPLVGCAKRTPGVPADPMTVAALQPPAPPDPGPDYQISFDDELHIRFTYQPEMNEKVPVRPDGRITLASTGELTVVGLTPAQLEDLIVERSSTRLRDPEVRVIVTKLGERRVYIGGEVVRPGYVQLRRNMTPLQAVLQSGGFRNTAQLDSVILLTPDANGDFSAARVDMEQVVKAGVPERVRLHPNDVLYVPASWVGDANTIVDLYVRGLIPVLPRAGLGYSLN